MRVALKFAEAAVIAAAILTFHCTSLAVEIASDRQSAGGW